MRKRGTVLTVAACLIFALVSLLMLFQNQERQYRGRPISEWVEKLNFSSTPDETHNAIQQIGGDAIPLLLTWIALDPNPSKVKESLARLLYRLPLRHRFSMIDRWLYTKDVRAIRVDAAMAAFEILGPVALPAAPRLARLATVSNDSGAAHRAVDALVKIGPLALPSLLSVVTNQQAQARFYATRSIALLGPGAKSAVPIVLFYLTDKAVAGAAFEALGRLKLEPQIVIPVLINRIHDPDAVLRSWAILTLADYGSEAKAAGPDLAQAMSDKEVTVRESATNALQIIAPEFLTTPIRFQ